ncbi:aldo/keto reductase [Pseudoclavibacter sp. 13-3]|uniref:aldo/keto reductase n=1 Tax=Pseudoclavibacter sp. 13-3 TaxID=2901228 RepID=UPI001E5B79CB|nr:aldo/keto reductase [Pseudoclavibacter sp. 13-3]MCD7102259.1 aldo/keto reductase [Pseudoclavibacter sp. 13-3]
MTTSATRVIGKSGIEIFPLAFGGNVFGWTADEQRSHELLDRFTEGGGNLIDTADSYSEWADDEHVGGESETIIGSWLRGRDRSSVVIATKVAKYSKRPGLSPANVAAAADESLQRLGTDYIDLYYAHEEDPNVPIEQTAQAFDDLVRAGKIRAIGVSNFSAESTEAWLKVSRDNGWAEPVAIQPHYNLVHRNDYEEHLAPLAARENLAVLPYWSLASGFLTGKYREPVEQGDSPRAGAASKYAVPAGLAVIDQLDEIAHAHQTSIATIALAWLLTKPQVVAPNASASRVDQVAGLLAVGEVELTADEVAALDQISTWGH